MKKTILGVSALLITLFSCKNDTTAPSEAAKITVETPKTDLENLEGKVINTEDGEWYVVKDGMRWRALSEPSTTDYLKSIEDGNDYVLKNVSLALAEQLPIGGEILPNIVFKDQPADIIYNNKLVETNTGEWFAIKDGERWRALSEPATTAFLKSIENGRNNIIKNVGFENIEALPIAGEVLPDLVFKRDKN